MLLLKPDAKKKCVTDDTKTNLQIGIILIILSPQLRFYDPRVDRVNRIHYEVTQTCTYMRQRTLLYEDKRLFCFVFE